MIGYLRATGGEVTSTEMPDWRHPKRPRIIRWHPVWQHLPKGVVCWKGGCRFSTNIAVILFNRGAHSSSLMCLKKVAALSERRSCRRTILFVTVYNIKRNSTDPHQKGQEKGEEHRERPWEIGEGCWRSNLWSRMILVVLSFGQVG